MQRPGVIVIFVAIAGLFLVGIFGPMFFSQVEVEDKIIRIEPGMGALEIAELLDTAGLIRQQLPFLMYVVLTGNVRRLQAGEYSFDGEYAPYVVADLLSEGFSLSRERTITIPEGFTLSDVEERLGGSGLTHIINLHDESPVVWSDFFSFLRNVPSNQTLEGFLFPDTYTFERETTQDVVARKMLLNFEERTQELRDQIEQDGKDLYDIVILASILEKEVPPEDMRRAAGVLAKRMEAGMGLQVDATLSYALGRPATRADINSSTSPYNTYKYRGLPPGPIANPGLIALEAATYPEENEFWYYLTRPDTGETVFSRTFNEHDQARAEFLR